MWLEQIPTGTVEDTGQEDKSSAHLEQFKDFQECLCLCSTQSSKPHLLK